MKITHNKVLVIDDNEINRKYIKSVLSKTNFQTILKSSGFEGIEYLKYNKVDLIVIDIQMPEMDGFECFDKIKSELNLNCPILATTAFSATAEKQQILSYGYNDIIPKPFKPSLLIETIMFWAVNFQEMENRTLPLSDVHHDQNFLIELEKYTDELALVQLLQEFIEETKSFLPKIAILKEHNKHTEILSILHTIKGNAGTFGFLRLSSFAAQLENLLKSGQNEDVLIDLDNFMVYTSLLLEDYKRLLKTN
ncbi:MAG TPA: response regulator [Roseivirga sp.]